MAVTEREYMTRSHRERDVAGSSFRVRCENFPRPETQIGDNNKAVALGMQPLLLGLLESSVHRSKQIQHSKIQCI